MAHTSRRTKPIPPVPDGLERGPRELFARDPELARIHDTYGLPRFSRRPADFSTLLHIILEQQLSVGMAAKL
ncbi:MAG TPA: hypothetical protein VLX09_12210 [Stellaceae bacterium]|nr:hypothetical protein [Stellaceae bacterium]